MKFGFYNKQDKTKELIDSREFKDIGSAVQFFSTMKALPVEEFLKIFNVVLIKEDKNG